MWSAEIYVDNEKIVSVDGFDKDMVVTTACTYFNQLIPEANECFSFILKKGTDNVRPN